MGFGISNLLIDFAGVAASSSSYAYAAPPPGGTLTVRHGTHGVTLALSGCYDGADFHLATDRFGGRRCTTRGQRTRDGPTPPPQNGAKA